MNLSWEDLFDVVSVEAGSSHGDDGFYNIHKIVDKQTGQYVKSKVRGFSGELIDYQSYDIEDAIVIAKSLATLRSLEIEKILLESNSK